jgi:hypothetical protein
MAAYRNSQSCICSKPYIYSIIIRIWITYTFFIKSLCGYPRAFPIFGSINSLYRLSIVSLYRYHYTKYIWTAYKVAYKGPLYFGIPSVIYAPIP